MNLKFSRSNTQVSEKKGSQPEQKISFRWNFRHCTVVFEPFSVANLRLLSEVCDMQKYILLLILFFPSLAFGQSYAGSYRAVFFNLYSEPKMIIAEFEVNNDNSLNGKIKIDDMVKSFSGDINKSGRFEAVIEQTGNFIYKLKGKFDKANKISLVQRNQTGSGLNKSVSESALEGKFSKVVVAETNPSIQAQPQIEPNETGKSRLKVEHSNPLYGTEWTNFTATVGFGNSSKTPVGGESKRVIGTSDASNYFVLLVSSKIEKEQNLRINAPLYTGDKKIWRQNELRVISYRESSGEQRNSFLAGGETLRTEPRYAGGKLEIISETDAQIVFKLIDFKIKRLTKEDFVTLNGFIYANK